MGQIQEGILASIPEQARYLFFTITPGGDVRRALINLSKLADGKETVVGVGQSLAFALGREISGLRAHPAYSVADIDIPSTPAALWCWLRGNDRDELVHRTYDIAGRVAPALSVLQTVDAFRYKSGFDLFGYEDGTENPKGTEAMAAAAAAGQDPGLDGGSFVAVQRWVHDLARFREISSAEQDHVIGRRSFDNVELPHAPASAHVKRTAQESFSPAAFILRRSMPWVEGPQAGLMFVAFGRTFDAFESLLRRMVGAEDGIVDGLFVFTRPVFGGYFWCPPVERDNLDLRALGL